MVAARQGLDVHAPAARRAPARARARPPRPHRPARHPRATVRPGGHRVTRILIVEDEESYREPLAYQLALGGYGVVTAATGTDALEAYDREGADLVLLDLMLPGLSGTEVCRELRLRGDVPVIMLTAKDGEIDKVVGLEL